MPVADVEQAGILLESALQLLEQRELRSCRSGASLSVLKGLPVERRGHALGSLEDVLLDTRGHVHELVVDGDGARRRVALEGGVSVGGRCVASAA